jgi:hypothetical protein
MTEKEKNAAVQLQADSTYCDEELCGVCCGEGIDIALGVYYMEGSFCPWCKGTGLRQKADGE